MTRPRDRARLAAIAPPIVLLAVSAACLLTSPTNGDFWWSDAPRHGLNGLFLHDLLLAHPVNDPVSWALGYYLRRPALTILFYPPFFYAVEALAFLVLGFSHFAAQATVAAFLFLLGVSTYRLAGFFTTRPGALAAALLTIGMPETALWGRQVMLDIPAYALIAASASLLLSYIQGQRPSRLWLAAAALLAAIYTKYNAGFVALPMALTLLACRGTGVLRNRQVIGAASAFAVLLVPALYLFIRFGGQNLASVTGLQGSLPLDSLGCWLYYLRILPMQTGWCVLAAAAPSVVHLALRLRRGDRMVTLLLSWLATGYVFFSLISLKEPRDSVMVLLPLAVAIPVLFERILPDRLAAPVNLGFASAVVLYALLQPVPSTAGYQDIAAFLGRTAPRDAVIVYSGPRDGNLVFDVAALGNRPDLGIIRADKLLLSVPVGERRRGVTEEPYDADGVRRLLDDIAPDYLVIQPDFWSDIPAMQRFLQAATGPDFQQVARFDVIGALSTLDGRGSIIVLAPRRKRERKMVRLNMDMPVLGHRIEGGPAAPDEGGNHVP